MSATTSRPVSARPGKSICPCLARWNVTVTLACTASPSARPLAPSIPEGMSTATTGSALSFMRCTAESAAPDRARLRPVPYSASTIAAHPCGMGGASL